MRYPNLLFIGGTGFIGQAIISHLARDHPRVVVPTRQRRRGRDIMMLPTVEIRQADVHDDATLDALIARADAVFNLVGLLHDTPGEPWGPGFERAHVQLPARIAKRCASAGKRLIHLSALGAGEDSGELPSAYLRSKTAGEKAIRDSGCTTYTILRPSVVFGPGDSFLTLFASLQRWLPVMVLARPDARLQPVFVGDLAQAATNVLDKPATFGKTYEIAGPTVYTLRELVRLAGRCAGHERPVIGINDSLGRWQAKLLEMAPGPTLMSVDNFESLSKPNVASGPLAPELGLARLASIETIGPTYLQPRNSVFNAERARARR